MEPCGTPQVVLLVPEVLSLYFGQRFLSDKYEEKKRECIASNAIFREFLKENFYIYCVEGTSQVQVNGRSSASINKVSSHMIMK